MKVDGQLVPWPGSGSELRKGHILYFIHPEEMFLQFASPERQLLLYFAYPQGVFHAILHKGSVSPFGRGQNERVSSYPINSFSF